MQRSPNSRFTTIRVFCRWLYSHAIHCDVVIDETNYFARRIDNKKAVVRRDGEEPVVRFSPTDGVYFNLLAGLYEERFAKRLQNEPHDFGALVLKREHEGNIRHSQA